MRILQPAFKNLMLVSALISGGLIGCTKTDVSDLSDAAGQSAKGDEPGAPKSAMSFISFNGGSSPWKFNVYGSNGCYMGQLYRYASGFWYSAIKTTSETTTNYNVMGQTDHCGEVIDASQYSFVKGPNASTPGPVYYIYPTQGPSTGRKILKLQFKGFNPIGEYAAGGYFMYDPSANTWTAGYTASGIAQRFVYSVVTSMPGCTIEC